MQLSGNSALQQPAVSGKSWRIALLVLFIDLLGFGIVLPILPYIVAEQYRTEWLAESLTALGFTTADQHNGVLIGAMSFAFSFAQFVMAPWWGRLSDRIGRKPVLSASMFGYTVSWGMFLYAPSIEWLFVSRLMAGFFAANIATAQAYMADVFPSEKRGMAMGMVGAALGLGFTLGPGIGALGIVAGEHLTHYSGEGKHDPLVLKVPVIIALCLSLTAFVLAVTVLRESLPVELRRKRERKGRFALFRAALKRPIIGPLLLSYFTVTLGFALLEVMFPEFNRSQLKLEPDVSSLVWLEIGLIIVVIQGGLMRRLVSRHGLWALFFTGLVIEALALFAIGWTGGLASILAVSAVLAVGNSLCAPSMLALLSQHAPPDEQGGTMGLASSASSLGRLLGPILSALMWGYAGPEATFSVSAIIVLLAIPLVLRARRHKRDHAHGPGNTA